MTSLLLGALLLWAIPEGIPPDEPVATPLEVASTIEAVAIEPGAAPVDDEAAGYAGEDSEGGTPQPLTLLLFGSGIVGLALSSRRARRAIQGH